MSDIHEELKEIFRQALQAKSPQEQRKLRQKGMEKMYTAPKKYFYPGYPPRYRNDPLYIEAADIAWDYIVRKIYGKVRGGKAYDPDDGGRSPIILWNRRCKGEHIDRLEKQRLIDTSVTTADPDTPYGIEDIQQPVSDIPRLELVRQEIENDPTGELRGAFVRQTPPPPITAQEALLVIYDRTACGEKWTSAIVAKHFNIAESTFSTAWRRTLEPLLRKMGDRIREMEEF